MEKVRGMFPSSLEHELTTQPGLYSPGAPHTWKLVFEADHHIFEVLLSACSDDEEVVWRNHMHDRILAEHKDYQEYSSTNMDFCSCRSSDIKPVGDVFGRPGTLARHQSLMRGGSSSTLESDGQYVVINNFLFADDANGSTNLKRSYSALNFNGLVPTVNLKRGDRNRVEARLADVWTRDLIPFNATRPKPHKEPSGAMIRRRLSMLSLLSGGSRKALPGIESDVSDVMWEEDYDYGESTIRRASTLSFSRTKSTSYYTAPSSPTKRSSSLSSRFSFNSSVKKENLAEKPSPISKRRSIMPLLDGKWRATDDAIVEATAAELREATEPELVGREEGYFSIAEPTAPPNSIQEEELSIHAALDDDYMKLKAGGNDLLCNTAATDKSVRPKAEMSRRHTIMTSPRARPKPWKSVKRAKALSEPLFGTKLSGSNIIRSDR
jgi:hypothetical protein